MADYPTSTVPFGQPVLAEPGPGKPRPALDLPDKRTPVKSALEPAEPSSPALYLPDRRGELEDAFLKTQDAEPNRTARVMDLSRRLNEPEVFISKNLDAVQREVSIPPSSYWRDLRRNYPNTAWFLSDPNNMAIAKDDIDGMGFFERIVREARTGFRKGSLQVRLAQLSQAQRSTERATGQRPFEDEMRQIEAELSGVQDPPGFHPVFQTATQVPNMVFSLEQGAKRGIQGAVAAGTVAAVAGPASPVAVPVAASGGFTIGGTIGFFEAARTLESELAFREYIQKKDAKGNPLPRELAAKYADIVGTVNGAIEAGSDIVLTKIVGGPLLKLGGSAMSKVLSRVPGADRLLGVMETNPKVFTGMTIGAALRRAGLMLAEAELSEVSTEYVQEIATGVGGEAAKAESGQPFERQSFGEVAGAATAVISPTAQATLIPGLFGAGMNVTVDVGAIREAEQAKKVYLAMGDSASASKLKARLPAAHRKFVESVTQGTPVENVYIPTPAFETYFQEKNIDPAVAAKELGIADQLTTAHETGADLKVPMATWANTVAGTEHYAGLAEDVKFNPDGLTARQVREQQDLIETMTDNEAKKAMEANPDLAAGRDFVFQDIKVQLENAGRPAREASAAATIWANRAVAEAQKRGITPEEWYHGGGLRVVNPALPDIGDEPGRRILRSDIEKTAAVLHKDAADQFQAEREAFQRWRDLIGPGLKPPKVIGGQSDVLGEWKALPTWMKNANGLNIDEVEQQAREEGLLGRNDDIFSKLERLKAPEKPGRPSEYFGEARNVLSEERLYQSGIKKTENKDGRQMDLFKDFRESGTPSKDAAQITKAAEAVPEATPPAGTQDIADKQTDEEAISDFGEKIGGARKDTAKPGVRRTLAQVDDRPVWARKYVVMQGKNGKYRLAIESEKMRGLLHPVGGEFSTEKEAQESIPLYEVSRNHRIYQQREDTTKWAIYRRITDRKSVVLKGGFESQDAAMKYLAQNPVEIIETKFKFPEKPWLDHIERVGQDRRDGKNVTTKKFQEVFGFRGGEFGNWNMGSDGQAALNFAYDALLDLADAIGVAPQAMSLNGELAIAFGARGHGGKDSARAHYEPDRVVINMTKIKGAGSLAHEWFHALDNYLARQEGQKDGYVTAGFSYKGNTREELKAAFKNLMAAMTTTSETVAVEADPAEKQSRRAEENLKSYADELRRQLASPEYAQYWKKKKTATEEQLKVWDEKVARLMKGDGGEKVYIAPPKGASKWAMGHESMQVIREMNDIYKDVTGRSFDRADRESRGAQLLWAARSIKDMNERVKKAQAGATEVRNRRSSYFNESKRIDSYRSSDYWSTETEMGARAFEAFIYDKLTGSGQRSDYLVHGVENKYYALLDMKPYPEGKERVEINNAFQRLFGTIQQKDTDKGVALFQDPTDPRGFIQFTPEETIVGLLKADASTFMHESAHFWLNDIHGYVQTGKADEKYLADWKVLADWLGVKDDQKALTTDQQEKFARGFEAYLREGKAPSEVLRRPFALFRRWLTRLYREVRQLNVEMSDDVRGVLDRMLATEDEIAFAEQSMGYDLGVDLGDLPEDVRSRIRDLQADAREEAVTALLTKQMLEEMTPERKKFLDDERVKAERQAREEVANRPHQRAMTDLKKQLKQDPKAMALDYVDNTIAEKDRLAFDTVAEFSGHRSGGELARVILAAPDFEAEVQSRVAADMARFQELRFSGAMKDEALRAIHTDKRVELMALEREAFLRLVGEAKENAVITEAKRLSARVEAAAARQRASDLLSKKPLREATAYLTYFAAERNAAMNVAKALATKNFVAAAEFKRQQMLNHALALQSVRNRREIDRVLKSFERFQNRGTDLMNMPYSFVRQIDRMLKVYRLSNAQAEDLQTLLAVAKGMAEKNADPIDIVNATGWMLDETGRWRQETLADLVDRINDNYYTVALPPSLLTASPKAQEDMTLGELRDLAAGVKAISSVGRKFERFLNDFIKVDYKTAAAQAQQSIEKEVGAPKADALTPGHKTGSKAREILDSILNLPDTLTMDSMVNLHSIVRYLDGFQDDGPMQNYVYRLLKQAEDAKLARFEKMAGEVNKIFADHFDPGAMAKYKDERLFFPEVGRYFTREEVLSMALNWGNEGNRDRIRNGFNFTANQVENIMSVLTHKEWDFVQAVFDYLETFWPDILAMEMKVAGAAPERVKSTTIFTKHGEFRGGYYPLAYDFEKSADAFRYAEQRNALYKQFSAAAAHTEHGHTKARIVSFSRPVRLSLGVLFDHLDNVVHDLSFRTSVVDVVRFLHQYEAKDAIVGAIGVRGYKTIEEHVKAVASDQGEFMGGMEKAVRWFRFNTTFASLAYRLFTLPLDTSGNVLNTIWEIGPKRFNLAVQDFLSNPTESIALVNEKSERMRQRTMTRDRDLYDISKKWFGKESGFRHYGYVIQSLADQAISYPLWLEVYKRNVGDRGEQLAKNLADESVTRTMGSGSVLDQVGAQRGSEFKKVLSMFYTWSSMMFNRAWQSGKLAGLEYDKGNYGKAVGVMATATFYLWFAQAINENFWREMMRNAKSDDPEARKKRILSRILQQPFGYIWLVRDIAGFAIDRATGRRANIQVPFQSAVETVLRPAADAVRLAFSEEELDQNLVESAARAAAVLAGYPQQVNNLVFNLLDWMSDEGEFTWRDFLGRRTRN